MPLVSINRDFFTLISAHLTVSSVPLIPFISLLLSHIKILGEYEHFHDSIKMSSVALCGCAALYTRRTNLGCFRKQSAIRTSYGIRRDWKNEKMLHNSSYVIITG